MRRKRRVWADKRPGLPLAAPEALLPALASQNGRPAGPGERHGGDKMAAGGERGKDPRAAVAGPERHGHGGGALNLYESPPGGRLRVKPDLLLILPPSSPFLLAAFAKGCENGQKCTFSFGPRSSPLTSAPPLSQC